MTHDYKCNGTTSLYAAPELASGEVTGACRARPTQRDCLDFLNQHVRAYPKRPLHVVRGVYRYVPELAAAIERCIASSNQRARAFAWTESADEGLSKAVKGRGTSGTEH